ncbi:DUF4355 domain-containing protein [Ligilactobacillus animalis]|uniref:DUF4355 domain-containing protein n=1 Tax=Ligilactobacillus animalis TaxID=1605 RepID=UPI00266BFE7C|nr:DUF4355 domain-containing protein [Ligilactobacillus animalis]
MKLDLQYFAEEATETEASAQVEETEQEESKEEKLFTQEEVNEIVRKRMERADREQEKKISEAKSEAVKEATKLAKMNAEQKRTYELEQANKRAQEAENELAQMKMQAVARKMFAESGVTTTEDELALVVSNDAETTKTNVEKLTAFANRIREQVANELLAGKTPKSVESSKETKNYSNIEQLSMKELTQLHNEDPERFKQLLGGR